MHSMRGIQRSQRQYTPTKPKSPNAYGWQQYNNIVATLSFFYCYYSIFAKVIGMLSAFLCHSFCQTKILWSISIHFAPCLLVASLNVMVFFLVWFFSPDLLLLFRQLCVCVMTCDAIEMATTLQTCAFATDTNNPTILKLSLWLLQTLSTWFFFVPVVSLQSYETGLFQQFVLIYGTVSE